jgi:general secretion pathway protein D
MKKTFKSKFKAGFLAAGAALISAPALAQVVQQAVQTSSVTPNTQMIETGPVLDVVPFVLSDGYTINLTLIPSDTEFTGYGTTPTIPNVTGNLNVVMVPTVNPTFTVKEVVTTVNVWDNQTVVLGGLITSQVTSTKQQVPVLGDLPLIGRLFQSQSKTTAKENLMIFVTTLIVDPAGNRVHSDDELPFAQATIPSQPAGADHMTVTEKTMHAAPAASN